MLSFPFSEDDNFPRPQGKWWKLSLSPGTSLSSLQASTVCRAFSEANSLILIINIEHSVCHTLLSSRDSKMPGPQFFPQVKHVAYFFFGSYPPSFSKGELKVLVVQLCPTLRFHAVTCQAPLSMGFFRQEYWSVLPFPFPRYLPHSGIKPRFPALQEDSLPSEGKNFTRETSLSVK